jgi:hypothetical protein
MGTEIEDNRAHGTAGPARIVWVTAASAATRAAVTAAHLAERNPARGAMLRATVVSPALGRAVVEAVRRGPAPAIAEAADLEAAAGLGAAAAAGASY